MKITGRVLLFSVIASGIAVGWYGASVWPREMLAGTETSPTETIDKDQGMGGVAINQSQKNTNLPSTPTTTNDNSATDSNSPLSGTVDSVAPKQAEIKRATPIEYEYKALRSSNDPLPQPAWVSTAMRTSTAWESTTGNGVVVAVIDSGFALEHEDLATQWHQNSGETGVTSQGSRCWTGASVNKMSNNCDDDNNGYQDDWRGWDFVGINNAPQAGETNPNGQGVAHGTEVAGLVGAAGNNAIGTATVSWNNKIMPLQALSDDGSGYTSSISAAVRYAADNGASVINMSLGGTTNDPTLAEAITYAHSKGVVVVAAAGNCGSGSEQGCDPSRPGAMSYPALNPDVIAVGATTSTGIRASFSSYGPGLDVAAPGSGTLISPMWQATNQTSAYATSLYGTSFASPLVSSYIGLIKSLRPSSSSDDIIAIVNGTASKPAGMGSSFYSTYLGHGIIDAEAGVRVALSLNSAQTLPLLHQTGNEKSEHSVASTSMMSSGCTVQTQAYCTVWAQNSDGYDRYLPYTLTGTSGQIGWSWRGDWLGSGEWWLRSRSGDNYSTSAYQLFNKG
ncbi:MAG: S8 family serine peptidase [Candidatus Saccharimonadales bacterium]